MSGVASGPGLTNGDSPYLGVVKSFVDTDAPGVERGQGGYGFIACSLTHQQFGRDVFLHRAQAQLAGGVTVGDTVAFQIELNQKGQPQARAVQVLRRGRGRQAGGSQLVPSQPAQQPLLQPVQPVAVRPVTSANWALVPAGGGLADRHQPYSVADVAGGRESLTARMFAGLLAGAASRPPGKSEMDQQLEIYHGGTSALSNGAGTGIGLADGAGTGLGMVGPAAAAAAAAPSPRQGSITAQLLHVHAMASAQAQPWAQLADISGAMLMQQQQQKKEQQAQLREAQKQEQLLEATTTLQRLLQQMSDTKPKSRASTARKQPRKGGGAQKPARGLRSVAVCSVGNQGDVSVRLSRDPENREQPWGVLLKGKTMTFTGCEKDSVAWNSIPEECVGMVLRSVNGVLVHSKKEVVAAAEGCDSVELVFSPFRAEELARNGMLFI